MFTTFYFFPPFLPPQVVEHSGTPWCVGLTLRSGKLFTTLVLLCFPSSETTRVTFWGRNIIYSTGVASVVPSWQHSSYVMGVVKNACLFIYSCFLLQRNDSCRLMLGGGRERGRCRLIIRYGRGKRCFRKSQ